jgi:hypothetical protein
VSQRETNKINHSLLLGSVGAFMVAGAGTINCLDRGSDAVLTAGVIMGSGLIALAALLPRLTGPLEFGPSGLKAQIDALGDTIIQAEIEVLPSTSREVISAKKQKDTPGDSGELTKIISDASSNPYGTLLYLAGIIEQRTRLLLAQTGWLSPDNILGFRQVINLTEERRFFSVSLTSSLRAFFDVRNVVAHSPEKTPSEQIITIIDLGVSILRMLDGIPHEENRVHQNKVRVFEDPEGKRVRQDVQAIVLTTTSPGGIQKTKRIFPTTRDDYLPGQLVAWEWNTGRMWGESWYLDSDDHKIKYAWTGSTEFVGRPL